MNVVVLDANAVIGHGRAFPAKARDAVDRGATLVLPRSVKRELVDEVIDGNPPANHRRSAEAIQSLIDEGVLETREPDYDRYGGVIDEARRRIADESLPEHRVAADRFIPAIVCELASEQSVQLVTGDRKLRETVRIISEREDVADAVSIASPLTVL